VVVLYPDEVHDGRAGTEQGFGYRIVYVEPALLVEAVRAIHGRPRPFSVREGSGLEKRDVVARGPGRSSATGASLAEACCPRLEER
jgi:hypothetical protein